LKQIALTLALTLLLVGGVALLHRNDQQARDTIRKHHLADIEQSLYFVHQTKGTFPPYDQASWCGVLTDPKNSAVKAEVEDALRQQNDMYKNLAKPFPIDPKYATTAQDYFYWKRSPTTFELYATLEADKTGDRNSLGCPNAAPAYYDYGIASINREPQ
jgi:hypothetical protein